MVSAIILNAQIFGEMAVLISKIKKQQVDYQEKLDVSNTIMANINLPHFLQQDIHEYFNHTMEIKDQQN